MEIAFVGRNRSRRAALRPPAEQTYCFLPATGRLEFVCGGENKPLKIEIGFVGIGAMGRPMAANLIKAGYAVRIADARPAQASKFAAETGARVAVSLRCW